MKYDKVRVKFSTIKRGSVASQLRTALISENAVKLWDYFVEIIPINTPQIVPLKQLDKKLGLSYAQLKYATNELIREGIIEKHTFKIHNKYGTLGQSTYRLLGER